MLDPTLIKSLLGAGVRQGGKGLALILPMAFAVWLAVGQRMDQQDALISAQTAEIEKLRAQNERLAADLAVITAKVRDQAEFDQRLLRLESAVLGQKMKDAHDWRVAHCLWVRAQGLDVPSGVCDTVEHDDVLRDSRRARPSPKPQARR